MYCSNCGQELNTDAKFCSNCGTEVQHGTLNNYQEKRHQQSSIICPKCKLHDKIEKVTTIVKSQTRTREQTEWETKYYTDKNGKDQSYSYPRSYDVVEVTDLAKRLSPPPKPQANSFSSCALIMGGLLIFGSIPFVVHESIRVIGILLIILGSLVFVSKINHDSKEGNRIASEISLRENAIKAWNRLYYCYRDDIVFDSEDIKNTCQPENITKFCYEQGEARASISSDLSSMVRSAENPEMERQRVEKYGVEIIVCSSCGTKNSLAFSHCLNCSKDLSKEQLVRNPYL